jgi:hypothetical protein
VQHALEGVFVLTPTFLMEDDMKALRNSLFAAVGLVILVGALVPSLSDARGFGFKFGFANRVAGSYLGEFNDGMNPPVPVLFAFNRGGTATASFNNEGDIGTPMYGSWRSTGLLKIGGTFIDFLYDPGGNFVGTLRADFTQTFDDRHFNTFTGDVVISIFFPGNDPLDPASVPDVGPIVGPTVTGQRIPAAGILP